LFFSLHVQQKDGSHTKHSLALSLKVVTDETLGLHFVWRQIISILTYCIWNIVHMQIITTVMVMHIFEVILVSE